MSRLPLPKKAGLPASFSNKTPFAPAMNNDFGADDDDDLTDSSPLSTVGGVDSIKVSVRIRPLIRDDRDIGEVLAWRWDQQTITQDKFIGKSTGVSMDRPNENMVIPSYNFDHIFTPEDTNDVIYDALIRQLVSSCMEGYHGSVFSYGQTSSGKTFTMNGTSKQPGIIPLAVYDCFSMVDDFNDREFLFRASYLEVYNEQVKDLLNPDPIHAASIKIQHDPKVGTVISGIKEQVVANAQQVMALLQGGESHRHVGSTNMNEKSSRAHTIFRLKIESKDRFQNTSVRISTLNLIDLAGSENARMTGSTGDRAKEAKFINQSLLTLSTIIQRLSEESSTNKRQHLPYRDSKLTRILQEPLSGNALIAIICTMSPGLRCAEESNNTLRFATRAKKVQVAKANVNEDVDDKALLKAYRQEIEQLKAKLAAMSDETAAPRRRADDEDDGREKLLQMIEDMERFIVKADTSAIKFHHTPTSETSNHVSRRHSVDSSPGTRPGTNSPTSVGSPKGGIPQIPVSPRSPTAATTVPSFEIIERKEGGIHSRTFKNLHIDPDAVAIEPRQESGESFEGEPVSPTRRLRAIYSAETSDRIPDADVDPEDRGFFEAPSVVRRNSAMDTVPKRPSLLRQPSAPTVGYERRKSYVEMVSSGEHILQGVAQMLQSLKAQIAKASLGPGSNGSPAPLRLSSQDDEIESLKLDIKLKDADSRFLQEELEKKDRIMMELSEGLKEVAVTHQQWAEDLQDAQLAYEAQAEECAILRQRIVELEAQVRENENLRTRVQILESVLRRKDKQISELSGVTFEKNDEEPTDLQPSHDDDCDQNWRDSGEDVPDSESAPLS